MYILFCSLYGDRQTHRETNCKTDRQTDRQKDEHGYINSSVEADSYIYYLLGLPRLLLPFKYIFNYQTTKKPFHFMNRGYTQQRKYKYKAAVLGQFACIVFSALSRPFWRPFYERGLIRCQTIKFVSLPHMKAFISICGQFYYAKTLPIASLCACECACVCVSRSVCVCLGPKLNICQLP